MKSKKFNTELLKKAWEDKNDCFAINFLTNQVTVVRGKSKKIIDVPKVLIDEVATSLISKGINKYALDIRAANLLGILVIGRRKAFDKYMKEIGMDKVIKPLEEFF